MDLAQIFKKTFSGFDAVGKTQVSDSALTRTTAINVATPNPMTGPVGSPTATRPPGSTSAEEEEPLVDVESPPLDATSLVPLSVVCPDDEARLMEEMYVPTHPRNPYTHVLMPSPLSNTLAHSPTHTRSYNTLAHARPYCTLYYTLGTSRARTGSWRHGTSVRLNHNTHEPYTSPQPLSYHGH